LFDARTGGFHETAFAIEDGLGRRDFQVDPAALRSGLLENGYAELPVDGAHVVADHRLPLLDRDPFDRMLIAQALVANLTLATSDDQVAAYDGPIPKVSACASFVNYCSSC
jgi:PIN domain nuclease of toxin-antitoxin system